MKRSTDRILTTHVGSLARPQALLDVTPPRQPGMPNHEDDPERLKVLTQSIANVVHHQAEIGVDVISDGEFGKSNWQAYIMDRASGYEAAARCRPRSGAISAGTSKRSAPSTRKSRRSCFQPRTKVGLHGPDRVRPDAAHA